MSTNTTLFVCCSYIAEGDYGGAIGGAILYVIAVTIVSLPWITMHVLKHSKASLNEYGKKSEFTVGLTAEENDTKSIWRWLRRLFIGVLVGVTLFLALFIANETVDGEYDGAIAIFYMMVVTILGTIIGVKRRRRRKRMSTL